MEVLVNNSQYFVALILLVFSISELAAGLLDHTKRKAGDYLLESSSFIALSAFIKPGIVLATFFACSALIPRAEGVLGNYNFFLMLLLFLLVDDVFQYWYHRIAHKRPFLWKLHRPHHLAREMGLLVSYRNAALYYVLMPNILWIGFFTFFGGGPAAAIGLILKQFVIISSHSPTRWDRVLYRFSFLSPVAWIVEHIFVTPAFHFAHHGKSHVDRISDPNGNYGNMFSFWDQIFGTALFTRQFPAELGLPKDLNDPWLANLMYPFVYSPVEGSEISKGVVKNSCKVNEPCSVELEPGDYLYCRCGFSKNQPFCDGSHHGTKFKPMLFAVEKQRRLKLCRCKNTKSQPFCDNSHSKA